MSRCCFIVVALIAPSCAGLVVGARPRVPAAARIAPPKAVLEHFATLEQASALLAEILDEGGERVYGAVDAPGWVAPVAGIAAIGTALLPVVLAPGEEAFKGQQKDEVAKNKARFGEKRKW
jgi:hypothetical protein